MTTAVLRPNSLVSTGNGGLYPTPGGGGNTALISVTDDLDSTYASEFGTQAPPVEANSPFSIYDCTSLTLPSGAVTKSLRARIRGTRITSDSILVIEVLNGSSIGYAGTYAKWTGIAVITELSGSYVTVSLSQAEVDQLRLYLKAATFTNGRINEAYIDLVYVVKPVVSVNVVTPNPYTTSRVVPISWTNSLDADGGGQTRYQMKVFTAAQYSIGGFSPETSPNTSSSGDVASSAQTLNTGTLARNVTYRAYVKVAQTVNAVALWGDWVFVQFTMGGSLVPIASGLKAQVFMSAGTRAVVTLADGKTL